MLEAVLSVTVERLVHDSVAKSYEKNGSSGLDSSARLVLTRWPVTYNLFSVSSYEHDQKIAFAIVSVFGDISLISNCGSGSVSVALVKLPTIIS